MHMQLRILVLLALAAMAFAGEPRLKVLIVTGQTDLPYHDWRLTTPRLRTMLEATARFDVSVAERAAELTAADLAPYDVLLLNYNGPRWPAATEAAVERFVASGKGMFSFHGASYGEFYGMVYEKSWHASPTGDKGWPGYARLIGATWDPPKIGHGARHVFAVKWVDREHPIARGLAETFEADDELYHRLTLLGETHAIATAYSDPKTRGTGKHEPIVWTAPFGQGRVVYTTLGHDVQALEPPGVAAVFTRGVEWAATGAVTLPPPRSANH